MVLECNICFGLDENVTSVRHENPDHFCTFRSHPKCINRWIKESNKTKCPHCSVQLQIVQEVALLNVPLMIPLIVPLIVPMTQIKNFFHISANIMLQLCIHVLYPALLYVYRYKICDIDIYDKDATNYNVSVFGVIVLIFGVICNCGVLLSLWMNEYQDRLANPEIDINWRQSLFLLAWIVAKMVMFSIFFCTRNMEFIRGKQVAYMICTSGMIVITDCCVISVFWCIVQFFKKIFQCFSYGQQRDDIDIGVV